MKTIAVDRVAGNVRWHVPGGGETGEEPDTETAFLLQICGVVERLIDEERRLIRLLNVDIVAAAAADYYVNVAVANAGLRVHAAVHQLFDARVPDRLVAESDLNYAADRLCGDPAFDLKALAEMRKLAFMAQLEQVTGVEDWRSTTWVVGPGRGRDEAVAVKIVLAEVDRVVKRQGRAVRENVRRCDVPTLARFGAALGQDYARSASAHRTVMDTLADQLWTSATDAASRLLAERLTAISSMTVIEAAGRVSRWLSNLSQSTSMKV